MVKKVGGMSPGALEPRIYTSVRSGHISTGVDPFRRRSSWSVSPPRMCSPRHGLSKTWLSNVRPVKLTDFDDSTQRSQAAVELARVREKMIRFVIHVVLRNSGLLLSRADLKVAGATIDLKHDQQHLENLRTTVKLSTTPAGHREIDLLNRHSEVAIVNSPKVLAKGVGTSQVF